MVWFTWISAGKVIYAYLGQMVDQIKDVVDKITLSRDLKVRDGSVVDGQAAFLNCMKENFCIVIRMIIFFTMDSVNTLDYGA